MRFSASLPSQTLEDMVLYGRERKDLLGRSVDTGRKGRTEVKGLFSQQRGVTHREALSVSRNGLKRAGVAK